MQVLVYAMQQPPRFLITQQRLSLAERYRWLWNQRYPFMLDQPDAMIPSMLREIALRSCIAMQDYRRLWDSSVEHCNYNCFLNIFNFFKIIFNI
ncbi:hypothetical protein NC651_001774 [Populus alba x Populus x berolinensis]|nr:hypothetical protein NC651_001774 [Populus alba x Populus x berolinensis]